MKKTTLPVLAALDYIPYPKKDDGFMTRIVYKFSDIEKILHKNYTGKLTESELPKYIKAEFVNCEVTIKELIYFKNEDCINVEKTFKA